MDEDTNDIVKIATEIALQPLTKVIDDAIGLGGGDYLHELRERRRREYKARTEQTTNRSNQLLNERGVEKTAAVNDGTIFELVAAAQDEGREELRELWARLLAAILDPKRAPLFRKQFIEIAKHLEPIDAAALPLLIGPEQLAPNRRDYVANKLGRSFGEVQLAFDSLTQLGLIASGTAGPMTSPYATILGKQFLFSVT